MNPRINKRISEIVLSVSKLIGKPSNGMSTEEERIAVVAALVGLSFSASELLNDHTRQYAFKLAKHVHAQISPPDDTSPIVGPQGQALKKRLEN